jgi:hypothetical protein
MSCHWPEVWRDRRITRVIRRFVQGSGQFRCEGDEMMNELDPHILSSLTIGVAPAAMIVLGRSKRLLEARRRERCVSCGRVLEAARRCPRCG